MKAKFLFRILSFFKEKYMQKIIVSLLWIRGQCPKNLGFIFSSVTDEISFILFHLLTCLLNVHLCNQLIRSINSDRARWAPLPQVSHQLNIEYYW